MLRIRLPLIVLAGIIAGTLFMAGCDDATGPDVDVGMTFEGRVTDDAGFGKTSAAVEGALVTASNVSAGGSSNQIDGQATTNVEGRFVLDARDAGDEVVLVAVKNDFTTKVMVFTDGGSTIRVMPMTTETHGEADVFVEARRQDDADDVAMSDVALFVTQELAADAASNAQITSEIAATIVAEARTRKDFMRAADDEDEIDDAHVQENRAFIDFHADLSAVSTTSAQRAVLETFEQALIEAYTDAGVEIETQARARQAARAAVARFSESLSANARFHLRSTAEIMAARATSAAVEAFFLAHGATSARVEALQQARTSFLAGLRAATSVSALAEARAQYESTVEDELASEIGVNAAAIATAGAALATARTALELALATASSARAVAQAHATFYASAESAARGRLSSSDNADLGAKVLALLSAD